MTKVFGIVIATCLFLIVGAVDYASALTDEAMAKDAPAFPMDAPPGEPSPDRRRYWDFDEGPRPKDLRECAPEARVVVSYNNAIRAPWRRFCTESSRTTPKQGRSR